MRNLELEAGAFAERKTIDARDAAQSAALAILCGIDIRKALALDEDAREIVLKRLGRMIERERLKGTARHWSYDLNRHIALKQALDRLRAAAAADKQKAEPAS